MAAVGEKDKKRARKREGGKEGKAYCVTEMESLFQMV